MNAQQTAIALTNSDLLQAPLNQRIPALLERIIPQLQAQAAATDRAGAFVAAQYELLKQHDLFAAVIPAAQGGGDLSYSELAELVRQLAHGCGSTALSFAMHSHPVALNVFKAFKGDQGAIATLTKIAEQKLVIAGTGANDWLQSNGEAVATDGGFLVSAHKRFVSGSPAADILVTSAVHRHTNGEIEGEEVLHFAVPIRSPGITVCDNWDSLGMRGTGSQDVLLEKVFVPATSVAARRPVGEWHALWDTILPIAMPVITGVYVGLAEHAFEIALNAAQQSHEHQLLLGQAGNALTQAQLAWQDMVRLTEELRFTPSRATSNAILTRKTLATQAISSTVEKACQIAGGAGFAKGHALERITRDIRAMPFHPLPEQRQWLLSGRCYQGNDPVQGSV